VKAVVAAFNQEKALVGAFSVITNLRMELFQALVASDFGAVAMVRFPQQVCTIHTCFKNILMVSGKQRSGWMKT